jgi:hypothetical protein
MSLSQIALELLLGLGVALLGANLVVLTREARRRRGEARRRRSTPTVPSMTRVWVRIVAGAALTASAALTLLARTR